MKKNKESKLKGISIEKVKEVKDKAKDKIKNTTNKLKEKKKKVTGHKVLIVILSLAIVFVSAILIGAVYIIISAPEFDTNKLYNKEASVLLDKNGNEFARLGVEDRDLVSYDDLPQVLIDAIVATEDSRFFQHQGFDIARFLKASVQQVLGKSGAGGASTLTMQVVKNTYSDKSVTLTRKFTDIYMAIFKLEKQYTKEEIMEFYVNSQFMGNNIYGVEQASQKYFGKSVKDLTLSEAAIIAGIFNAPTAYNPFQNVELCTSRRNRVLDLMYLHGYINEEQRDDAKAISVESLIVEKTGKGLNKYQSFIDTLINQIVDETGLDPATTPMTINTTLDPDVQDVLNALNNGELGYKFINDVVQVAIVVTDTKDGSITAVDGRRNQTGERQLNLATSKSITFQPGSTAKPIFAYGPLIEYNNASTGTYFWDDEYTYSNGTVFFDSDRQFQGMQTMRTALANSRNIPAVQALQQVDKAKIAEFVHALGIDYGKELYESYAIGGGFTTNPLAMAGAYGAFARGGYYIEPYSYTKITFKDTNEVTEHKPKRVKVMSEETAYMINSMLTTAQSQGVGGNFSISGTDVGAKTGTSTYDSATLKKYNVPLSTSADNWNITYSPDYVISLWYGYERLSHEFYTDPIKADSARKRIMAAIAKKIYKKNSRFDKPSSVVEMEVEKFSVPLQLPSEFTPADMRITELFRSGTEPTEVSTRYSRLDNPTNGKGTISGNSINLSWEGIKTPAAIDTNELQNYFNENYKSQNVSFANKYYQQRISYNNSNIGTLGYNVYLDNNGQLQLLGYTSNTSYTYNTSVLSGNYKFVIKSAYSIFKSNASTGLEIKVSTGGSSTPDTPSTKIGSIALKGNTTVTEKVVSYAATYNDPGITVKDSSGKEITNYNLTKIYKDSSNNTINNIMLNKAGTYTITYKVDGYSNTLTRTVIVK
jgi:penicillin-binding protein 1A